MQQLSPRRLRSTRRFSTRRFSTWRLSTWRLRSTRFFSSMLSLLRRSSDASAVTSASASPLALSWRLHRGVRRSHHRGWSPLPLTFGVRCRK